MPKLWFLSETIYSNPMYLQPVCVLPSLALVSSLQVMRLKLEADHKNGSGRYGKQGSGTLVSLDQQCGVTECKQGIHQDYL